MKYSIIIPTKDRTDLLQRCLQSIHNHAATLDHEIIVVATGDASLSAADRTCIVLNSPGATFAQAVNAGAHIAAGCENLILLNDDVQVQNDLLQAFALASLQHDDRIIGARLLYPDGLVQHAGIGFDQDGNPYNMWRLAPSTHPDVMQRRRRAAVTFACVLIPRQVWDAVGGLDEDLVNSYEDADFCLRAAELGYSTLYDPHVWAIHAEGQSAGRNDRVAESWQVYGRKWLTTGRWHRAVGVWPFAIRRG